MMSKLSIMLMRGNLKVLTLFRHNFAPVPPMMMMCVLYLSITKLFRCSSRCLRRSRLLLSSTPWQRGLCQWWNALWIDRRESSPNQRRKSIVRYDRFWYTRNQQSISLLRLLDHFRSSRAGKDWMCIPSFWNTKPSKRKLPRKNWTEGENAD